MDERRTLSLNVFLNTLEEGCKNERRYCFILGAGASKTSGIPTGEELAKQWHGEILEQCSKEEIKELKKRLGVRSTKPSSRAYFDLYAMRFFPDYQNGSAFLERTLERAQPSLGYYPLAALLANTRNNLVITTNFDSLVEDALTVSAIAAHLGISERYLSRLFYKCTRHTVLDFINSYRINQSVLLIAEGHSLTFISESVGFSSPPHYTKVFKKYMGVTPRDYRKTLLDTIPLGSP